MVALSAPRAPAVASGPSADADRIVTTILDNLRRAGVQNTKRAERLGFTRLDAHPGVFVQGVGEYVEGSQAKIVAVAIGPEFGTVGPELICDAPGKAVTSTATRPFPRRSTRKVALLVINHHGDEVMKVATHG